MFTGLVEALGTVCGLEADGVGRQLTIAVPSFGSELAVGDRVAINGACTTLGFKPPGASVNLETDLLAKYVWKCLHPSPSPLPSEGRGEGEGREAGFVPESEPST